MASTGRTPLNQHWALINPNHPACGQIEFIAPAPRGTFGSIRCNTVLRISTHNQSHSGVYGDSDLKLSAGHHKLSTLIPQTLQRNRARRLTIDIPESRPPPLPLTRACPPAPPTYQEQQILC